MTKRGLAWVIFGLFTLGLVITMPLWLLDRISNRAMIGITLALSWLAPAIEAVNGLFITDE